MVGDVEGVFVAEVAGREVVFGFQDIGGGGVGPFAASHLFDEGVELEAGVHGGEAFLTVLFDGLAFFFALGLGFFPSVAAFLELGVAGLAVVAAEAGEFAIDLGEAVEARLAVHVLREDVFGEAGKFQGEEGGEAFGEVLALGLIFQEFGLVGEAVGKVLGMLEAEPVLVAAFAPFAEVGFVDGIAFEVFLENGLDGGEGVEPFEDFVGWVAVDEVLADLFADFKGEAGDFGAHRGGSKFKV